jgi:hypothetical protein
MEIMDRHRLLKVMLSLVIAFSSLLPGINQGRAQAATARDANSVIQMKLNRIT